MRFDLLAHSDSGIGDIDQNVLGWNKIAAVKWRCCCRSKINNRRLERELAAGRHRVARVHGEIENDLRNLAWVGLDVRALFLVMEMANDGNILADEPEQ